MPQTLMQELIEAKVALLAPNRTDTVAAAVTLRPTPFSRKAFNRANEIQPLFNELVLRTVQERSILDRVCSRLAEQDDFVRRLYQIFLEVPLGKLFFNVNRSDYMVEGDNLYQIELNTISASLAGLSTNLARLRRKQFDGIPENEAVSRVAQGMKRAVEEYCREFEVLSAAVLFVVQESERNVYDQAELSDALASMGIKVFRRPLNSAFELNSKTSTLHIENQEIGLIYYRAGYSPNEYTSEAHWQARELLELSRAIKCPDIGAHLAGLKKIQQVLTEERELQRVMLGDAQKTCELRSCFAKIYSLDPADPQTAQSIQEASNQPERFVLKPQREGGGNNIYGKDIKAAFASMSPDQLSAYILMQRIRPAITPKTPILRNGQESEIDAVSELGIYGYVLASAFEVIENETCGWLLRTKPVECDEGGLITGYSVLDCPQFE